LLQAAEVAREPFPSAHTSGLQQGASYFSVSAISTRSRLAGRGSHAKSHLSGELQHTDVVRERLPSEAFGKIAPRQFADRRKESHAHVIRSHLRQKALMLCQVVRANRS